MMNGMPMVPQMQLSLCDVRDAARAHVLAMTNEQSNGQRIIITTQPAWLYEIAEMLNKHFAQFGELILFVFLLKFF